MHFRKGRQPRTNFSYTIGDKSLEIVSKYKYLGVIFDEKLSFTPHSEALGKASGRTLGGHINKVHNLTDFGFKSYEKLLGDCVIPVMDYRRVVVFL